MAKPNYAFNKRQKEIAKKKKKEEKRLQKTGVDDSQPQDVQPISDNNDNAATTSDTEQNESTWHIFRSRCRQKMNS